MLIAYTQLKESDVVYYYYYYYKKKYVLICGDLLPDKSSLTGNY